jgi:predicted dehydrogenase
MIAEFHLKAWLRIPQVEIVALGDANAARAEARRAQLVPQARTYSDLAALLEKEDLDFIDILTPPRLHRGHCLLAKQAGVHIICQKPLSDDWEDARTLVARMENYPKLFVVHENHRHRPWFGQVVRRLHEGFFGTPRLLRLEQHDPSAPSKTYRLPSGRGLFLEYGVHLVDMTRALLGEPTRVYARFHPLHPEVTGESLAHVVYEYEQATAVIDIAWKPAGPGRGSALLQGERGEAFYEGTMTAGETSRFRLLQGATIVADETRSAYADYAESFYAFQRACAEAMLGGPPVTQTGAENLQTLRCTFAAYHAAERNRVVNLAEFGQGSMP